MAALSGLGWAAIIVCLLVLFWERLGGFAKIGLALFALALASPQLPALGVQAGLANGQLPTIPQVRLPRLKVPNQLPQLHLPRIQQAPGRPRVTGGRACPVAGGARFSDDWHAPRTGHLHQGNDLFAAHGTPLVAVESGRIGSRIGNDGGRAGLRVWLEGASGMHYFYAHNAAILVHAGQRVRRGQPIARVGNTGNAASTPPHVHFEMHPSGGAAINPYPYISRWCR